MVKKLTKTGNSVALVLDRALLERTGLTADAEVEVSTDGRCIVISPVPDKKRAARFKAVMERINHDFSGAFARLAK